MEFVRRDTIKRLYSIIYERDFEYLIVGANMKLHTYRYTDTWNRLFDESLNVENSLLLVFTSANKSIVDKPLQELVDFFSKATVVGASSAGKIDQDELLENSIVVAVLTFASTRIRCVSEVLLPNKESFENGVSISNKLLENDLRAMFLLSDGLHTNGSKLTKGIASICGKDVVVTGGLAGDNHEFQNTYVIVDGKLCEEYISAVGFYGDKIHVRHGSGGGWDNLGVKRLITKSKDNVLYELDSQPALDIYKRYLGERASELPGIGIHFPIELSSPSSSSSEENTIRTILGVDEEQKTITFAGDIAEGSYATLMRANNERLIDGATLAAEKVNLEGYLDGDILSIAISCVGRKLVLKQQVEEELEATLEVLPDKTQQIGFYSYGEISPVSSGICDLHNETMTLTVIWEDDA